MANTENVFCCKELSHPLRITIFSSPSALQMSSAPPSSTRDSAKLKMDEFSYLLSEYAGDDGVQAYVEKLIEVWTSIAKMQKFINQTRMEIDRLKLGYPDHHEETKVIEDTHRERKAITA
jgi:hypothetical protein